jgi:Flp pilus assembly pilin Flp
VTEQAVIDGIVLRTVRSGASTVEYAVMLALIIVIAVVAVDQLGASVYNSLWETVEALE